MAHINISDNKKKFVFVDQCNLCTIVKWDNVQQIFCQSSCFLSDDRQVLQIRHKEAIKCIDK